MNGIEMPENAALADAPKGNGGFGRDFRVELARSKTCASTASKCRANKMAICESRESHALKL